MNPRLIKFMVELQNPTSEEKENKDIYLDGGSGKGLFDKLIREKAPVTVPVNKIE